MKIGFIGLGIMGQPMCENILKKQNDDVFVYTHKREVIEKFESKGAIGCVNASQLAKRSDIIITMVTTSEDSKEVYTEILDELKPGKICIDMSTINPFVSQAIAESVRSRGAEFADAPVVKSKQAAAAGELGIYVGCSKKIYDYIYPILSYMGKDIKYMGDNGRGLIMKICHNALVSQIQNGVNETLALADKYGISAEDFAQAISYGGGQNAYLDTKKKALASKDYTTAFSVKNMAKDINICMELADKVNLPVPGEKAAADVYKAAVEEGYENKDFSAVYEVVLGRKCVKELI